MKDLLAGYRRFRENSWPIQQRTFEALAEDGQSPTTLVIACADSRVDPAMIFDVPPGEIFTIRNVAALVPPYSPDAAYHGTSAALEFAVRVLEVADIIVLGHGKCGGIHALLEGTSKGANDFIAHWMHIADKARDIAQTHSTPADQHKVCEHEAIKVSLENLMGFPWVAEAVKAGKLTLHGAWFDIRHGALAILGEDGKFKAID